MNSRERDLALSCLQVAYEAAPKKQLQQAAKGSVVLIDVGTHEPAVCQYVVLQRSRRTIRVASMPTEYAEVSSRKFPPDVQCVVLFDA